MKKINLIFDFDSTICRFETIEVLAEIALKNKENKEKILNDIKKITSQAMDGKISFPYALQKRVSLLNIKKEHLLETIDFMKGKLTRSFYDNIDNFNKNINNSFIISGGFIEIILPLLKPYGFNANNIFANSFLFNSKIATIDKSNVLSMEKGKNLAAKDIKGDNIIIGDGYTDYELKKYNNANIFILFTENIFRRSLESKADFIANNFNDVFDFIAK